MRPRYIFIEGASTSTREGLTLLNSAFGELFQYQLQAVMLVPSGGKTATIRKFKDKRGKEICSLLIDLDGNNTNTQFIKDKKKQDLTNHGLTALANDVFFMVTEIESWFLSQPHHIKELKEHISRPVHLDYPFAKEKITSAFPKYTKSPTDAASTWLRCLDIKQLRRDFDDVERLYQWIHSTPHV